MKLYLNGELVGENVHTGGLTGNQEAIAVGGSLMWNRSDSEDLSRLYVRQSFDGHIDELSFFNRQLEPTQIRWLMEHCLSKAELIL